MSTVTTTISPTLAIFGLPGGAEWIIILVIGLLLFGRRLPEVGRSLGQSIVEFKKGLKTVKDEVDEAGSQPKAPPQQLEDRHSTTAVRQMDSQRSDPSKVG
jgi:sec-independent protein translocase protein TatA